ncbi:MAG: pentapeptide repeat-containing protein, partial [Gemmatimonadales bacterium]
MAAGEPTDESRSRRTWWWIAAGVLALLLITGLVLLWIKAPDLYRAKDGAAQATATTRGGILTVAAASIAATAAGAGLYFTARTIRLNQQALLETQRTNREADERGRQTLLETRRANREADRRDRYAKAIEQLGHDKAPVRLGAMYSLERLAQDNLELRQAVVDVLCAFLRMPFKPPNRYEPATESRAEGTKDTPPAEATDRESERAAAEELLVRQTAQRLLAAHLRRPSGTSGVDAQAIEASPEVTFWPGISLDLSEASLVDLDLRGTSVIDALFDRASFSGGVSFRGATFSGNASFDGASFSGDVSFREATFSGNASFDRATFSGDAWFREATFSGDAGFHGATFSGDALFDGVTFSGDAWFRGATFSGNASFDGASFSGGVSFHG